MRLRALIVDDEPPARRKIRLFLEARGDIDFLGEAGDGVEAVERLLDLRPELVFLDIQMPRGGRVRCPARGLSAAQTDGDLYHRLRRLRHPRV
jgi:DNA-binding NarL/FixJ family response regulator